MNLSAGFAADVLSQVVVVDDKDGSHTSEYIRRYGAGCLYHRPDWDRVFDVYGLRVARLAALCDGTVVGLLPLVFQRSPSMRMHLVSLPWFDSCGVLADDDAARHALVAAAVDLAESKGARTLQLRQASGLDVEHRSHSVRTDKVLLRLPLEETPERQMSCIRSKVKNQIRKAEKSGLAVEMARTELLEDFYNVYSTNMRDLGSPAHSLKFFRAVMQAFGGEARIHIVRLGAKAVGCGLTIANGDRLEIPWASSLKRFNSYCVNHIMYWNILKQACREGYRWFYFGRSTRGSGPYRFKRQWGAEEATLYWYSLRPDGQPTGQQKLPADSYQLASQIWRRLPLWLTRAVGPKLIARLP